LAQTIRTGVMAAVTAIELLWAFATYMQVPARSPPNSWTS
jgi:hypothetical protein